MEKEIWKSIAEPYSNYMVSDKGNIKRNDGIIIKPINPPSGNGYFVIKITANKYRKITTLHRIVAEAFIPNPDNKPQVNHINGKKCDNSVSNLEWVTRSENIRHAIKNKLTNPNKGEQHHNSVLTKQSIEVIFLLNKNGFSINYISKAMGVSKTTISLILKKKAWKHL